MDVGSVRQSEDESERGRGIFVVYTKRETILFYS